MTRDHDTHDELGERAGRVKERSLAWLRRLGGPALVTAAAVVALLGLAVVVDLGTASPKLCLSCHEMSQHAQSWSESAHATVGCVECHQAPTKWYAVPQRVAARARLLGRDLVAHQEGVAHAAGETSATVDIALSGEPVGDEICLQCHDPNRKATSGFRILIDHPAHAKRNGSCVSCHVRTAHPLETRGTAMSLMSQCFTCHGKPDQPKASTACGSCHPAGYELLPASHAEDAWKLGHGAVAKTDPTQCTMCHDRTLCDGCHGLEMPHPAGWADGEAGHATVVGTSQPEVCTRCHGSYPDLCTSCHHEQFNPGRGSWIDQHDLEVKAGGSVQCFSCHEGPACSYCHTKLVENSGL